MTLSPSVVNFLPLFLFLDTSLSAYFPLFCPLVSVSRLLLAAHMACILSLWHHSRPALPFIFSLWSLAPDAGPGSLPPFPLLFLSILASDFKADAGLKLAIVLSRTGVWLKEWKMGKESEGNSVGERKKWKVKAGDADLMTVWLTSGSCLDECVLVGGEYMQIYSDFERAFNASKGRRETLCIFFILWFVASELRFDPSLAFLSQPTLTVLFHSKERPKVHAIFIVQAVVMTCISTDYKIGFVMLEEPVECQEESQACWKVTIYRDTQRKTCKEITE